MYLPLSQKPEHPGGLTGEDSGISAAEFKEELTDDLIRTDRTLAILRLLEIALPDGQKLSISEAVERNMMPKKLQPAIEIRVFRTKDRVSHNLAQSKAKFMNAKSIVEKELKMVVMGFDDYAVWYVITLAEELTKLHEKNKYHGNLSPHNATLACELVDFEDTKHAKRAEITQDKINYKQIEDVQRAEIIIDRLVMRLDQTGLYSVSTERLIPIFRRSYKHS